jgi:hypothetical protein
VEWNKMKNYTFYLYNGSSYYEDTKKLSFIKVSDPTIELSYISMHPDEVDKFTEVVPGTGSKQYRSIHEKMYRNLTNMSSVIYLTEETFNNVYTKTKNYLNSIEDYERMCVVRDVKEYYNDQISKKKSQIEDYIKHFNKLKK